MRRSFSITIRHKIGARMGDWLSPWSITVQLHYRKLPVSKFVWCIKIGTCNFRFHRKFNHMLLLLNRSFGNSQCFLSIFWSEPGTVFVCRRWIILSILHNFLIHIGGTWDGNCTSSRRLYRDGIRTMQEFLFPKWYLVGVNPKLVKYFEFFFRKTTTSNVTIQVLIFPKSLWILQNMQLIPGVGYNSLVDEFGQWINRTWPGTLVLFSGLFVKARHIRSKMSRIITTMRHFYQVFF